MLRGPGKVAEAGPVGQGSARAIRRAALAGALVAALTAPASASATPARATAKLKAAECPCRRVEAGCRDSPAWRRNRLSVPAARLGSEGPERPGGGDRPEGRPTRPGGRLEQAQDREPSRAATGQGGGGAGRLAQRRGGAVARAWVGEAGDRARRRRQAGVARGRPLRPAAWRLRGADRRHLGRRGAKAQPDSELQDRARAALQPESGGRARKHEPTPPRPPRPGHAPADLAAPTGQTAEDQERTELPARQVGTRQAGPQAQAGLQAKPALVGRKAVEGPLRGLDGVFPRHPRPAVHPGPGVQRPQPQRDQRPDPGRCRGREFRDDNSFFSPATRRIEYGSSGASTTPRTPT